LSQQLIVKTEAKPKLSRSLS